MEELEIGGGHLFEGDTVVEGRDGDITTVKDGRPGEVGIYSSTGIEATEGGLTGGGRADGTGSETGTCIFKLVSRSRLQAFDSGEA